MDKRCLIVTYYFPPTGGGGVQRILKLVKYLSLQDWQFKLVTATPDVNNGPQDRSLLDEIPHGLDVVSVRDPISQVQKGSLKKLKSTFVLRWLSSLLFIPDIRKNWARRAEEAVLKILDSETFDCILVSSPPYSLALVAARLQKSAKIPVILDMRDAWTTNPYKIYPSFLHRFLDARKERFAIANVLYGVSCIASMLNHFQEKIPDFQRENWRIIPNGYDEADFKNIKPVKQEEGIFHIAFSGTTYSHLNNPEPLIKAMAILHRSFPDILKKIIFHHIGQSVIDLNKMARAYAVGDQVRTWGYQNHQRCLNILSGMDALIFFLDSSNPQAANTLGGKVYEYLRLGLPIIGVVPQTGEAAALLSSTESGVVVDTNAPADIARIIVDWVTSGANLKPKPLEIQRYDRATVAAAFGAFLDEVIMQKKN